MYKRQEVNGKKITQKEVVSFITQMQGGQQFLNPQGIHQITDELVNQELMYIDALENKLDEDEEFTKELEITKENMLKNYSMHKLFESIEVSDEEIKNYYDKMCIRDRYNCRYKRYSKLFWRKRNRYN